MAVTKGVTEVLTGDELRTFIYERHYQREIASGGITGSVSGVSGVTTTHKIEPVIGDATELTGWSGSIEAQYTDGQGKYFRRDYLIETLKNGKISPLNTNTYPVTTPAALGATGSFSITGSLPGSVAGSILVSYSSSLVEKTDEVTNFSVGGGGRTNTYVAVQNGKRVKVTSVQEARTVSIEALSIHKGWVDYLNGIAIQTSIDNTTSGQSGSDLLRGSVGAQPRPTPITIIERQYDAITGNQVIDAFFNVDQVSNETTKPSEGQATETAGFDCQPQDYCRLDIRSQQG